MSEVRKIPAFEQKLSNRVPASEQVPERLEALEERLADYQHLSESITC